MNIETIRPMDIEKRSFSIIRKTLGNRTFPPEQEPVILRAIHTSADFDYADNLYFSPRAVEQFHQALSSGADIVTDTKMAKAGISQSALSRLGGQVHCFISDEDVATAAKERQVTRAIVSMEKACTLNKPLIFAIGNAPTALLRLVELAQEGKIQPAGIIGVPVGFVNVVESKELLIQSRLPSIVARGRKGGSNIAAAVCNALLYQLTR